MRTRARGSSWHRGSPSCVACSSGCAMRASIAARRAESAKGLGKADAAATTARPRAESAAHAALCCEVRTRDAPERWVTKGGAAPGGLASGGLKEQPHAATERAEQRAVRC